METRPLKKVVQRFRGLRDALESGMLDEIQGAISQFLVDYDIFTLGLQKHEIVHAVNHCELANFESEKNRIDAEMDAARIEIEELKISLAEEERLRRNRQEYDVLAVKINALPTRQNSIRNIERLKRDIANLQSSIARQKQSVDRRREWMQQIAESIQSVRAGMKQDTEQVDEEAEVRLLQAASTADTDAARGGSIGGGSGGGVGGSSSSSRSGIGKGEIVAENDNDREDESNVVGDDDDNDRDDDKDNRNVNDDDNNSNEGGKSVSAEADTSKIMSKIGGTRRSDNNGEKMISDVSMSIDHDGTMGDDEQGETTLVEEMEEEGAVVEEDVPLVNANPRARRDRDMEDGQDEQERDTFRMDVD